MRILILMQARVLREFSPEEVTANIYTMVDVLLHHIQLELQRGHLVQVICLSFLICSAKNTLISCLFMGADVIFFLMMQDLLSKAITNLVFFIWTHELLPLDILLLALIDRDDDPYALRLVVSPFKSFQGYVPNVLRSC